MDIEDQVLEFDEEFAELMSKANDSIPDVIRRSDFPYTVKGTLGLMAHAGSIKLAMIDLAQSENLYGISILYRSLIEHYIRFQYLVFRWAEEGNDQPGKEYDLFSRISEDLEMAEAFRVTSALKGNPIDMNPLELMKEHDIVARDLSKRQIQNITSKWKYRTIIKYMSERQSTLISERSPFLAHLIPAYAELSSFVHGGQTAERMTSKLMEEGKENELAWEHAKWGCILANSMNVFFIMILGQTDSCLLRHFKELDASLRKYLGNCT